MSTESAFLDDAGIHGPLWVDSLLKDPNFYYRFVNFNVKKPYKMEQRLKLGYQFCTKEEFPNQQVDLISGLYGKVGEEGDKIYVIVDEFTKAYLMKLPIDVYNKRQALREQRRSASGKARDSQLQNQFGFKNLS
jgi:hypothetical protein